MQTKAITCVNCATTGILGTFRQTDDDSVNIFRHLGHNPFSGHVHYQCPACKKVMLVEPLSVLKEGAVTAVDCQASRARDGGKALCDRW